MKPLLAAAAHTGGSVNMFSSGYNIYRPDCATSTRMKRECPHLDVSLNDRLEKPDRLTISRGCCHLNCDTMNKMFPATTRQKVTHLTASSHIACGIFGRPITYAEYDDVATRRAAPVGETDELNPTSLAAQQDCRGPRL